MFRSQRSEFRSQKILSSPPVPTSRRGRQVSFVVCFLICTTNLQKVVFFRQSFELSVPSEMNRHKGTEFTIVLFHPVCLCLFVPCLSLLLVAATL